MSQSTEPMADDGVYLFPLSFAQLRLWFLDQLVPGSAFYNVHNSIPLKVAASADHLRAALNDVIRRHEILRTTFVTVDYEPRQRVVPALEIDLPVVDLSGLSAEERAARATSLAEAAASAPFDLTAGPLIRASLIRMAPADNLLLLTLHHIICDGWSLGILMKELNACYTARLLERPTPLPDLPIQYVDFAIWQKEWMEGSQKAADLTFWSAKLADLTPLDLPTDRPRPSVSSYRGAQHQLVLPPHLLEQLRELGRRLGATMFMTLLAGFQMLLGRYTDQHDIVVGIPTSGRTQVELEALIGFFVNTLAIRADLSGDPSVEAMIRRTRDAVTEALGHQDLPFEHLVEALQPERDLSRNPLFQVTFQLLSGGGDATAYLAVNRGSAPFDLSVNLWETPAAIAGYIEYSVDLFDAATIANFAEHYINLLKSMMSNPAAPLSALNLLGAGERRRLLVEWNATDASFPAETLHQLFEAQVDRTPAAVAVCDDERDLTYLELDRAANRLAHGLIARGIARGQPVAVGFARGADLLVAQLAVLKAGGCYLALNVCDPRARIAAQLGRARNPIVLAAPEFLDCFDDVKAPIFDVARVLAGVDREDRPNVERCPADIACILFTSGSTGVPKGVEIRHSNLVDYAFWHRATFETRPGDRSCQFANPAFDGYGCEVWPALLFGASVHVAPEEVRTAPSELLQWMAAQQIDFAFLPTPVAELLLEQSMPKDLRLRTVSTGGERLRVVPRAGTPFKLFNGYGPTECCIFATTWPVEPASADADAAPAPSPPIGRPVHNTKLFVLDAQGSVAPTGVRGELYISGAGVSAGYHNEPDLTAAAFVNLHMPAHGAILCYRTGDVVRYRADGALEFVGRRDSQVKIRGHRVELGEIEAMLRQAPGIEDAVAIYGEIHDGASALTAYVVPTDKTRIAGSDAMPLAEALAEFLGRHLPAVQVPSAFVPIEAIPLTARGKIDRDALNRRRASLRSERPWVAPRTDIERSLGEIFCEVCRRSEVGVFDHFFADLGGHSLLATQLVSRAREVFEVELPLQALFSHPTLAGLSLQIEEMMIAQITALSEDELVAALE